MHPDQIGDHTPGYCLFGIREIPQKTDDEENDEPIICVFIEGDGKAIIRAVETGIQDNRYIVVNSGVEENDRIITGPYDAVSRELSNGDEVIVSEKGRSEKDDD